MQHVNTVLNSHPNYNTISGPSSTEDQPLENKTNSIATKAFNTLLTVGGIGLIGIALADFTISLSSKMNSMSYLTPIVLSTRPLFAAGTGTYLYELGTKKCDTKNASSPIENTASKLAFLNTSIIGSWEELGETILSMNRIIFLLPPKSGHVDLKNLIRAYTYAMHGLKANSDNTKKPNDQTSSIATKVFAGLKTIGGIGLIGNAITKISFSPTIETAKNNLLSLGLGLQLLGDGTHKNSLVANTGKGILGIGLVANLIALNSPNTYMQHLKKLHWTGVVCTLTNTLGVGILGLQMAKEAVLESKSKLHTA